ncbi:MAG: pilus assembly PilX family protein [Kangiellaceae bacterium]
MRTNIYKNSSFSNKQQGAALFVSLIMLLALTIIGLAASQRSQMQERMAGNVHILNLAFNAAESALGGFAAEANTGDRINDPNHILYQIRTQGALGPFCFDSQGVRGDCGALWLNSGNSIEARATATVIDDCNVVMCAGFSLGGNSSGQIGCRIIEIDGTGTVGNQSVTNNFWVYEVTACNG